MQQVAALIAARAQQLAVNKQSSAPDEIAALHLLTKEVQQVKQEFKLQ